MKAPRAKTLPVVGLLDEYRATVATFLQDRDRTGMIPFRKQAVKRRVSEDAIRQLDVLDTRRAALRKQTLEGRALAGR